MPNVYDADAGDMASFQPRLPVCLIVGTRAEAIKIAPIVAAMERDGRLRPLVINTAQQPNLVAQELAVFGLAPAITVQLQRETGTLAEFAALLTPALDRLLGELSPRAIVVQDDSATALIGAQVASRQRIPVVRVEAGSRPGRPDAPLPEEANRRMIGQIVGLPLPPTEAVRRTLATENITGDAVLVTGNTSIDAISSVAGMRHPYGIPELWAIEVFGRSGWAKTERGMIPA
jgi:UDP-N-acetylglucosamine 2-epimerase (non-hydrolysing)